MIEELARQPEHVGDERAREGVIGLRPFAPRHHDPPAAQEREVLRHQRLIEGETGLQVLHRALTLHELLQEADARRMR